MVAFGGYAPSYPQLSWISPSPRLKPRLRSVVFRAERGGAQLRRPEGRSRAVSLVGIWYW
jgi:hypothetical protein